MPMPGRLFFFAYRAEEGLADFAIMFGGNDFGIACRAKHLGIREFRRSQDCVAIRAERAYKHVVFAFSAECGEAAFMVDAGLFFAFRAVMRNPADMAGAFVKSAFFAEISQTAFRRGPHLVVFADFFFAFPAIMSEWYGVVSAIGQFGMDMAGPCFIVTDCTQGCFLADMALARVSIAGRTEYKFYICRFGAYGLRNCGFYRRRGSYGRSGFRFFAAGGWKNQPRGQ